jgi:hypothetical protein
MTALDNLYYSDGICLPLSLSLYTWTNLHQVNDVEVPRRQTCNFIGLETNAIFKSHERMNKKRKGPFLQR